MDVYDSSIWLWGLLKDEPNTSRLIEDVVDGTRSVAISAYIHDEVTNGFKQVAQSGRIDVADAQMKFNTTIANMDTVQFPDQDVIGRTYAAEVRSQPAMRVLGSVLEIQTKDAPVLVFATDVNEDTTLYVADSGFDLSPAAHNLTNLTIEQVSVGR